MNSHRKINTTQYLLRTGEKMNYLEVENSVREMSTKRIGGETLSSASVREDRLH